MRPVMDDALRLVLSLVAAILIAIAFAALFFGLNACSPKGGQVATDTAFYEAELFSCVESAKTKQESQECREAVSYRYRTAHGLPLLDAGIKDGGAHD